MRPSRSGGTVAFAAAAPETLVAPGTQVIGPNAGLQLISNNTGTVTSFNFYGRTAGSGLSFTLRQSGGTDNILPIGETLDLKGTVTIGGVESPFSIVVNGIGD